MSYLKKFSQGVSSKSFMKSAVSNVMHTAEYAGASWGFGYLQSRYRSQVMGVPIELAAGVVGKALVLFGGEAMGLLPQVMPHVDVVSNAALGAWAHTLGVGYGARQAASLPPGKAPTKALGTTVLGAIPKAPHGDFLSASELAEMAR